MATAKKIVAPVVKLPEGVLKSDLTRPGWKSKTVMAKDADGYSTLQFEIWHSARFGWCIPTLLIGKARHRNTTDRTYATTLKGELVRIGMGPHVTATHTVYVKASRLKILQKYIDLQHKGAAKAGDTRDRISTRRAQTAARRGGLFGF